MRAAYTADPGDVLLVVELAVRDTLRPDEVPDLLITPIHDGMVEVDPSVGLASLVLGPAFPPRALCLPHPSNRQKPIPFPADVSLLELLATVPAHPSRREPLLDDELEHTDPWLLDNHVLVLPADEVKQLRRVNRCPAESRRIGDSGHIK